MWDTVLWQKVQLGLPANFHDMKWKWVQSELLFDLVIIFIFSRQELTQKKQESLWWSSHMLVCTLPMLCSNLNNDQYWSHSFCQYYVKNLNCDKLLCLICPSDMLLLLTSPVALLVPHLSVFLLSSSDLSYCSLLLSLILIIKKMQSVYVNQNLTLTLFFLMLR